MHTTGAMRLTHTMGMGGDGCTHREDRGWLSRGSAIGEHPRGLYGPSALHGVHYLMETNSPDLVIDVRRSRSVTTYYPGSVRALVPPALSL